MKVKRRSEIPESSTQSIPVSASQLEKKEEIVKSGRREENDDDDIKNEAPPAWNEIVREESKVVAEAVVEQQPLEAPVAAEEESKSEIRNSQPAILN